MASTSEKSSSVGMPQLDFSNFDNQAFWLLIFLFLVFLVIRILVMPRMEETLTNRRKIIEEDIQEAEEFRDKAVEIEKSLNDEIEAARIKANEILRNCKEEIKRNTQEALADMDIKVEELVEKSEKNVLSLKSEAKKEINALSKKLAPEIVKALIR
jgi:F-type H+-transporting ATPase subunit b